MESLLEAHIGIIGYIGSFVVAVAVGAIAWGTLKADVKRHDKAIEDCHMDEYVTEVNCGAQITNCPGSQHAQETYTKVVRIEADIQEMKSDLKLSDEKFHDYQVDQGASMARIETQLNTLLSKERVLV